MKDRNNRTGPVRERVKEGECGEINLRSISIGMLFQAMGLVKSCRLCLKIKRRSRPRTRFWDISSQ
jgi:hypothetical protein